MVLKLAGSMLIGHKLSDGLTWEDREVEDQRTILATASDAFIFRETRGKSGDSKFHVLFRNRPIGS
jgi:hypothetical protein